MCVCVDVRRHFHESHKDQRVSKNAQSTQATPDPEIIFKDISENFSFFCKLHDP